MSTATLELVRICEALPEVKQTEFTDSARFLLEREAGGLWEAIEPESQPRAKFVAFVRESAKEEAEHLDPERWPLISGSMPRLRSLRLATFYQPPATGRVAPSPPPAPSLR